MAEGGGRLEINAEEAARVRAIFQLYLEMESLLPSAQELERRGWNNKRWVTRKGKERGGKPFNKSTLFRLLTNPIYTGKVLFQGTTYDGEHEAIVDMARSNNANRSVQWEMLENFAEGNGYYEPVILALREKEKQQITRLRKVLKLYFQIDGDPIVKDGQGWKTVFVIRPEGWKEPQDETWDLE